MGDKTRRHIYTIGHSNHAPERFARLLEEHGIELVADIRSQPYSGYCPHFSKAPLSELLRENRIEYRFAGEALGGRPKEPEFYDAEGRVRYDRLAGSPAFRQGIEEVLRAASERRVALLCGEEDPAACHRTLLVGRELRKRGLDLLHIRGDGSVQTCEEVAPPRSQPSLFDEEPDAWMSLRSASRSAAPAASSNR